MYHILHNVEIQSIEDLPIFFYVTWRNWPDFVVAKFCKYQYICKERDK